MRAYALLLVAAIFTLGIGLMLYGIYGPKPTPPPPAPVLVIDPNMSQWFKGYFDMAGQLANIRGEFQAMGYPIREGDEANAVRWLRWQYETMAENWDTRKTK